MAYTTFLASKSAPTQLLKGVKEGKRSFISLNTRIMITQDGTPLALACNKQKTKASVKEKFWSIKPLVHRRHDRIPLIKHILDWSLIINWTNMKRKKKILVTTTICIRYPTNHQAYGLNLNLNLAQWFHILCLEFVTSILSLASIIIKK